MSNTHTAPELPFGIHESPFDGCDYQVSRTGIIYYPKRHRSPDLKPQVVSFVNGSMAVNPLNDFVCCINFDEYIWDVLNNDYRMPTAKEAHVAYFDVATGTYTTTDPDPR